MLLEGILPVPFESFAPEIRSMNFRIACHSRIGGVCVRYPKSVAYMDGI